MDLLCGAPEGTALDVRLIDSQEVFCGVETLKVALADGAGTWTVECLKGQVLRDVLLQVNLDVYDMKDKMMNCGGGGVCGTCVMRMVVADEKPQLVEINNEHAQPETAHLTNRYTSR